VRSPEETGYITTGKILGIGSLAKLTKAVTATDALSAATDPVAAEEARETLALLERLPPLYAEPLLLQATQGLSQRQIAELLDVPETTVETRLARGRRMLRQLLSEQESGAAIGVVQSGRKVQHHEHG